MSETKTDMMLNGICMVCENKDTLCTHIGQVKEECPFIQKAIRTKITNADRIRNMTDEELGKAMFNFILNAASNPDFIMSPQEYTEWLQSEAE